MASVKSLTVLKYELSLFGLDFITVWVGWILDNEQSGCGVRFRDQNGPWFSGENLHKLKMVGEIHCYQVLLVVSRCGFGAFCHVTIGQPTGEMLENLAA